VEEIVRAALHGALLALIVPRAQSSVLQSGDWLGAHAEATRVVPKPTSQTCVKLLLMTDDLHGQDTYKSFPPCARGLVDVRPELTTRRSHYKTHPYGLSCRSRSRSPAALRARSVAADMH